MVDSEQNISKVSQLVDVLEMRRRERVVGEISDRSILLGLQAIAVRQGNNEVVEAISQLEKHLAEGGKAIEFLDQNPRCGEIILEGFEGVDLGTKGLETIGLVPVSRPALPPGGQLGVEINKTMIGLLDQSLNTTSRDQLKDLTGKYKSVAKLFEIDDAWFQADDAPGQYFTPGANILSLVVRKDGKKVSESGRNALISAKIREWRSQGEGREPRRMPGLGRSDFYSAPLALELLSYLEMQLANSETYTISNSSRLDLPFKKK